MKFKIPIFDVYPDSNTLFDVEKQQVTKLPPKQMKLLVFFLENTGRPLSKDLLLDSVWKDVITTEQVLTRAVADLRKALDDSAINSKYITTVSKKGYQFIASVEVVSDELEKEAIELNNNSRLSKVLILCFSLISIFFAYQFYYHSPHSESSLIKRQMVTFDQKIQRRPRYSSDGSRIVFVEQSKALSSDQHIVVFDIENGTRKNILTEKADNLSISFSPNDNNLLAVRKEFKKQCDIYIYSIRDKEKRPISKCNIGYVPSIDWSAKADTLLTTEYDWNKRRTGIVFIEIHNKTSTTLALNKAYDHLSFYYPRLSTNGKTIVARVDSLNKVATNFAIIDVLTGNLKIVNTELAPIVQLEWGSEDDIYISSLATDNKGLWKYDLGTGSFNQLKQGSFFDMDVNKTNREFAVIERPRSYFSGVLDKNPKGTHRILKNHYQNKPHQFDDLLTAFYSEIHGGDFVISSIDGNQGLWFRGREEDNFIKIYSKKDELVINAFLSSDNGGLYFTTKSESGRYILKQFSKNEIITLFEGFTSKPFQVLVKDKNIYWLENVDKKRVLNKYFSKENRAVQLTKMDVDNFKIIDDQLWIVIRKNEKLTLAKFDELEERVELEFPSLGIHKATPQSWSIDDNLIYYYVRGVTGQPGQIFEMNINSKIKRELVQINHFPNYLGINIRQSINQPNSLLIEYLYSQSGNLIIWR